VKGMLNSLSRAINKTSLSNQKSNIYENVDTDKFLQEICQSKLSSEGVYGMEYMIIDDYFEEFVFTPQIYKINCQNIEKDWNYLKSDLKDAVFYEITLKNELFLPLFCKNQLNFINFLKNINLGAVFSQVLFTRRIDKWRNVAIEQYKEYLNGNDSPSSNKVIRSIQSKIINVFSNLEVKRSQIEDIENKILSNGYRFEMRIILFNGRKKNEFENKINSLLGQIGYYNELLLTENKNRKTLQSFIFERRFQINQNNLLSESEIYSLLCSDKPNTVVKVELEKPVKAQGVVKSLEDSMLIQNAIKLMPFSENKNIEVDQSKSEQINQAFKRVGIVKKSLKVTEMHQGSTLLKVEMIIPPEITYTSITKKLTDIKAALGNEGISVEIGSKPDTVNVFLPLENRGVLYFRDILQSDEFQSWCKQYPLPFIIGESVNGGLIFSDLAELRHLLVTGATGSGKSVFINILLLSLIINVPPDELALYLVDPKQVEYSYFDGFPQVRQIITDMKKADALLLSLVNEMESRYELFAKSGVKNITTYNKNNENKIPYIVAAIDEYADLVMVNPNVEDHLVRLGQKARAAGIHLIICTQKPLSDIVTSVLKSNLPSAISFRLKTSSDYQTVFGKGIPYNLLGKGDGVCRLEGQLKEYERFQSPLLTLVEEDEEGIYNGLKLLFKDVVVDNVELPEVESEMDKLKRIIANTNETRVSELQSKMGIAIGKVTDLLKQLLDDGWLRKEGRSYVVNVSDEELNKWRE
jgi:S-DNA-T family DNA segregation ATPase FtsK/SpoIIIE